MRPLKLHNREHGMPLGKNSRATVRARGRNALPVTGQPIGKNDIVVCFVSADGRKPDPNSLTIDSINIRELMDRIAREGRHICDRSGGDGLPLSSEQRT